MSDPAIKVERLGKKYTISHEGVREDYIALRDVISSKAKKLVKGSNKNLPRKEDFWALKNVSFEIKKGDAVGIIGLNGAGKTTLLKILSRITEPTTGLIEIDGRIASLLEVGTGFHPELTGRENIFLNGAILGMSRAEIRSKFDEIVDFSGVEKFLDTPVKRYSSGMYVRLAFAVAAHLEPEILVVDEVLAVGDAEFQKKCLGKMEEVSKGEGRTVLFVSHQLEAIKQLCNAAIYLKDGALESIGETEEIISRYLSDTRQAGANEKFNTGKPVHISGFRVEPLDNNHLYSGFPCRFEVDITNNSNEDQNLHVGVGVNDKMGARLFTLFTRFNGESIILKKGETTVQCKLEKLLLKPDVYYVHLYLGNGYDTSDYISGTISFEVDPYPFYKKMMPDSSHGAIILNQEWKTND
jgi:lipopolysaccharide transport system ATP-binding protein